MKSRLYRASLWPLCGCLPSSLNHSKPLDYGQSAMCSRLPRDSLISRFGAILPQRLGQALGLTPETFICERLKEPLSVFREWEVPVDDRNILGFCAALCSRSFCRWPGD